MGGHVRFVPQADIDVMREPFDQWAFDVPVRHVHHNVAALNLRAFMERSDRYLAFLTEEGRYRLLVEAVTDYAIYLLDPSGAVTTWNPGAQRFKGYTANEIIGQHFSYFTPRKTRR